MILQHFKVILFLTDHHNHWIILVHQQRPDVLLTSQLILDHICGFFYNSIIILTDLMTKTQLLLEKYHKFSKPKKSLVVIKGLDFAILHRRLSVCLDVLCFYPDPSFLLKLDHQSPSLACLASMDAGSILGNIYIVLALLKTCPPCGVLHFLPSSPITNAFCPWSTSCVMQGYI